MRELRGPFVGLLTLALVTSLFAFGLVSAARAGSPAALATHCLSPELDDRTTPDAGKDALCKLSCAIGFSSLAVDLPPPAIVPAPDFVSVDAELGSAPSRYFPPCLRLGGGSRAPPLPV
jgi:hypothetical protein